MGLFADNAQDVTDLHANFGEPLTDALRMQTCNILLTVHIHFNKSVYLYGWRTHSLQKFSSFLNATLQDLLHRWMPCSKNQQQACREGQAQGSDSGACQKLR